MDKKIFGNTVGVPNPKSDWNQTDPLRADFIKNKPTKLSQFENDIGYLTEHQDISGKVDKIEGKGLSTNDYTNTDKETLNELNDAMGVAFSQINTLQDELPTKVSDLENDLDLIDRDTMNGMTSFVYDKLDEEKADKTDIISNISTAYGYDFSQRYNSEIRLAEVTSISFTFGNGEYMPDYHSGLSFDSGSTPTAIDYTDSGILNWVGTDCTTADGLSIFQPSANTHYDIVFYFNGVQFIGLVNGYVPATGNVVSV